LLAAGYFGYGSFAILYSYSLVEGTTVTVFFKGVMNLGLLEGVIT